MHRIVVNVQTGEVTQVELTAEEMATIQAAQVVEIFGETPVEAPVEPPAEPSVEQ